MTEPTGEEGAAIVVGAESAIGRAVALTLARSFGAVTLVGADERLIVEAARELRGTGCQVVELWGDLGDAAFGESVVEATVARSGRVGVLVDVLTRQSRQSFRDADADDGWPDELRANVRGLYAFVRPAIGAMREAGGRIVLVSSRSWLGELSEPSVSAMSGAVTGFARALALEVGRFGVTVNVVAPAYVDTPEWRALRPDQLATAERATAVRRLGSPDDVAAVVAFLASPQAGFVTGQTVAVCGGSSIGKSVY